MQWSEYVGSLIGNDLQSAVAERTGVSQGTISRWLSGKGQNPQIELALDFARSCGGNPVEAMVVLGVIRPNELDKVVELGVSATDLTNDQLIELLATRLGVRVRVITEGRRGA